MARMLMKTSRRLLTLGLTVAALVLLNNRPAAQTAIVNSEFIFERPRFPSSHASTIAETREGLVAAWFGGAYERSPDVCIYLSRHNGRKWSEPEIVADGIDMPNHAQFPCWNPVLFQPRTGPLLLFYKVGPSPASWWGMMKTSSDAGLHWSEPSRLPDDIWGPIRCKPVELPDGTLLCGSSTENAGWRVHMERTKSLGRGWTRTKVLNTALEYGCIQPTILLHTNDNVQILCRSKWGVITETWSVDRGVTWSRMVTTALPNPNSGIDAVTLRDGRHLLVYNHTDRGRGILNVAVSKDGKIWEAALVLEKEPGAEFSYPAVIQSSDSLVHVTYTWKRKTIKHVVLDPTLFQTKEIVDGRWPL